MLRRPEVDLRAEPEIEVVNVLERVDQRLDAGVPAGALQPLDEDIRGDVALQRDEVGLFAGKELRESFLVLQDRR